MPALHITIGIVIGVCAGWFLAAAQRRWANRDPIRKHPWGMGEDDPYRLHESALTRSEEAIYRAIAANLPDGYPIFVKVRLADILQITYAAKDRGFAKARLNGKTLNFLVCDAALAPKAGVLLRPETPDRGEAQAAQSIARICEKAGLPLVSLQANSAPEEIGAQVRQQLGPTCLAA